MMYRLVTVLAVLATSGAQQDRTLEGVPSGLVELLNSQQQHHQQQQPQNYQYWDAHPQQANGGITVQTGYEGIIAPTGPAEPERGTAVGGLGGHLSTLHRLGGYALGAGLLTHLLPFPFNKILLFLGSKLGAWVVGIMLLLVVGSAATTAVCAFTPLCTISFLGLRFNRESVRSLLNEDRINSATQFVYDAIAKYKKLQLENRAGKAIGKNKKAKRAQELKEAREYTKVAEQTVAEKRDSTSAEQIVAEKRDSTSAEQIVSEKRDSTTTEQIVAEKRGTTAAREEIKSTTEVLKESTTPSSAH